MPEDMTVKEAAAFLGVSRGKIWALVNEGMLERRPNPLDKRQHLISREALERLKYEGRRPRED